MFTKRLIVKKKLLRFKKTFLGGNTIGRNSFVFFNTHYRIISGHFQLPKNVYTDTDSKNFKRRFPNLARYFTMTGATLLYCTVNTRLRVFYFSQKNGRRISFSDILICYDV